MIAEFSIVPIGKGESLSRYVAECIKIVKESGIRYQLTPMCTILEGDYDEVMDVIKKCHIRIMGMCNRVLTTIKIDDRRGKEDAMTQKVRSVEEKIA
ncbi:MAG: MTH1187 family thiamine-binding protein [Methanomassiliicoccales archaeon]